MNQLFNISIAALIIGVVYIFLIRHNDRYEKEPIGKMFATFALGGIFSVIISLFIYSFFEVEHTFLHSFLYIGPIEEGGKFLALILVYWVFKKEFNEPTDGLVYMFMVSLGFATIENVLYAIGSEAPYHLLLYRSFYCILGHMCFSGFMGIAFYIHKKVEDNYSGMFFAFLIASAGHGLYDGVLFQQELNFTWDFVFWGIVILQIILLRMSLGFSPFRKPFHEDHFVEQETTGNVQCGNCEESVKTQEKEFVNYRFVTCDSCEYLVFNSQDAIGLLSYYSPSFKYKRFKNNLPEGGVLVNDEASGKIIYQAKLNVLTGEPSLLPLWLKDFNHQQNLKALAHPVAGIFFKLIGAYKLIKKASRI